MEGLDRFLQTLAAHESHGIKRPAVGVMAQAIHRHNAWMLESAGDLGFQQEPEARVLFARITFLDLLERHLAMQFFVERHRHDAQAALGMRPQDAKAAARSGGAADVRER